jgi:hypothetical protein
VKAAVVAIAIAAAEVATAAERMRTLFVLLNLALIAPTLSGCHRAEVIENVPTVTSLSKFRSAGLLFARGDGARGDDDDVLSDVHDAVKERIEGTKLFASVVDGTNAELLIRVVLLGAGQTTTIGVELIEAKTNALLGRFQVQAQPDRKGPSTGGGLNLDFESKTSKAIDSAAREIASYLEDHK